MLAIPYPEPQLSDGVVSLRPWSDDDVAAKVAWGLDPVIVQWTGVPAQQTARMSREHADDVEHARRAGRALGLAVTRSGSDEVIGSCDMRRVDASDPCLGEIGYLLGPEARGYGFASRAVWLLTNWGFEHLAMGRVQALVHPDNPRSGRVLDRLGFQREGLLRGYRQGHEGREDRVIYSVIRGELQTPAR